MLDACYKPDADRRADLMKAKDDSVQLLQQQLDDLVVVRARGEIEQDKFLQRTIEIQQQMEARRQSKAQIASEDYNPCLLYTSMSGPMKTIPPQYLTSLPI